MDILQAQQWAYTNELPTDTAPARALLHSYSKIAWEDINSHLLQVRDTAWNTSPVPFIGRWKFLSLVDCSSILYRQVLWRLKTSKGREALLDLGCGIGQVLRQFRADGIAGPQLFGLDIEPKFIQLGHALFRDKEVLGANFVVGDVVDPDDRRLDDLAGKVTVIHAGSFFHLFNWLQQLYIGKQLVGFLQPGFKRGLVFGKQVVASSPRETATGRASSRFLHDEESFQKLWDEIGSLTRTKWIVRFHESEQIRTEFADAQDLYSVQFTVQQER